MDSVWINAEEYADAHGVDITTALERCLAITRNVFLPPGAHILTRTLVLGDNHRLCGGGSKNATKLVAGAGWDAGVHPAVVRLTGNNARLEHITVDARATTGPDCVRVEAGYEPSMAHCQVLGGNQGVNLLSGLESRFEHVSANGCAGAGFYVQNVPDPFLLNCSTDGCRFGLRANGGSITAMHFHAIKSLEHGFYLVGPGSSQFYGCHADTNGLNGFHVARGNNTRFTDCWSFRNGHAGTAYNWLFHDTELSSAMGCSSNNEESVAASFRFSGTNTGLMLMGCSASKPISGALGGAQFIGCSGELTA